MSEDGHVRIRECETVTVNEDDGNVLITGAAGTGKSTLLRKWWDDLTFIQGRATVVAAPTGVAAINAGGNTIHKLFGFRPGDTVDSVPGLRLGRSKLDVLMGMEVLLIDEVSMVRADMLDMVDLALRWFRNRKTEPFGGVWVILFGDPYQLPPVVKGWAEQAYFSEAYGTPFFFSARAFQHFACYELVKVWRQSDPVLVRILSDIRRGVLTEEAKEILNSRVEPNYAPDPQERVVAVTALNKVAEEINNRRLDAIKCEPKQFEAVIDGVFPEGAVLAPRTLVLKSGAQVMMLTNEKDGWWVNGTIGIVVSIEGTDAVVRVPHGGREVDVLVSPYTWEIREPVYDKDSKRLWYRTIGSYRQLPMRLAWAITAHKVQGQTLERVIVDIPDTEAFTPGQLYVALSRVTSIEGLFLRYPVTERGIFAAPEVIAWYRRGLGLDDKNVAVFPKKRRRPTKPVGNRKRTAARRRSARGGTR